MSSLVGGYTIKDITPNGAAELSQCVVNPGKVLPATGTGNLFAVTGVVLVTGLFGIVSTVFSVTNVSPTLGVTGAPAAIAAAPVAAMTATAVGSVLIPAPKLGGALPAAVAAQEAVAAAGVFVVNAADITITTNATNTGAITWVLNYMPLYPGTAASVAAV
jgi:hypothetical protein